VGRAKIAELVRERSATVAEFDELSIRQRINIVISDSEKVSDQRISVTQRGFAVAEILVALSLIVVISFATLTIVRIFVHAISLRSLGEGSSVTVEQQLQQMRGDAETAFAAFVPKTDVFHDYNAPTPTIGTVISGHEVDFYSRTDAGLEVWWAYYYDAKEQTLRRYDYDGRGNVGVADRNTGSINSAQHYSALSGVRAFSAQVLEANQLTGSSNDLGALLVRVGAGTPKSDPVGFVPRSGVARPDLYGGNTCVVIRLVTDHGLRTLHLVSSAMPSGFIIHQVPSIRAVTYRIDIVHRFWFGFAQITHSQIFNQLLYSYDPTSSPNQWKVWCDWELYGSKIAGLRVGDPNANYDPTKFSESAVGIYDAVAESGPHGNGTTGLNEQPGCHHPIPGPNAVSTPTIQQLEPDTVDTPPPCFIRGRCWPTNSPPDFTPPSPWPLSKPPPYWCSTHQQSPLCGGAGGTPVPIYTSPTPVHFEAPFSATTAGSAAPIVGLKGFGIRVGSH
jgi:hypothetical protein